MIFHNGDVPRVVMTKSFVVLEREAARSLARRERRLTEMVTVLYARLEDEHALLVTALHELALEQGKEPLHFTRRWISARRDESPPEGGEAPREA